MKIAIVEPFFGGAHKSWINALQKHLPFNFHLFTLPARHWKWRMEAGAISLAQKVNETQQKFDIFLVSDMLNLSLFKAMLNTDYQQVKIILYFHENQLTYPWSATDDDVKLQRDRHYQFINYTSALLADKVLFNSHYNKNSFFKALPKFLKAFPDDVNLNTVKAIEQKSFVLPLAFDLSIFYKERTTKNELPILLWNHRWEYDKNPELFFETLFAFKAKGLKFQLIVLGEKTKKYPKIFDKAAEKLKEEIIHFGYVESQQKYIELLQKADCLPVTSVQDFFGISVIEAIAAGAMPILPNQLAYLEHLDFDGFYKDNESFATKLEGFIVNWYSLNLGEIQQQSAKIFQQIEKYDWIILKAKYLSAVEA